MRFLNVLTGGYRRVMDRLLDLQNESFTLGNAPFANFGVDLVLSGCAIHDNGNGTVNIASGLIYIGGNTLRYDGGSNIPANGTKAFVAGPVITSKGMVFGDGSTKNIYSEQKAVVADQDGSNHTQIKIKTSLYDVRQYIQDQIYSSESKGTIKEVYDLDGHLLDNFDGSGLGVTPRWLGWALDNGNNGTPGSAGMVIVAAGTYTDPISGLQTVYANEDTGGEIKHKLTIAEMPAHDHDQKADIFNNAAAGTTPPAGKDGTGNRGKTGQTGGDQAHNNMQPYIVAYRVVKIV